MPRLVLANDQVMIYDDFLPREAFEPLLAHAYADSFALVHEQSWNKVWHPGDGLPLIGTTTTYRDGHAGYKPWETSRYPTGTPLDRFLEALDAVADDAAALVGKRGVTWQGLDITPYLHPRGCCLSLHRDRDQFTGSLTFYIHHRWELHWGGHLLILDPRTGAGIDVDDPRLESFLSGDGENAVVSEPGLALCVPPKPNRLVFLRDNTYHMVTRVDADAGDRPRVALAGFFFTSQRRKSPPIGGPNAAARALQ